MSQTEQRVTNLEIKVEDLTKELRNAMSFINTLRVMYEMQHPNEEDKSQAVSLASTIVDDEESIDLQLTPVIVGHEEEKLQAVSLASTIVDVEESVDLQLTLPSLVPTIVDELSLEPTLVEDTFDLLETQDPSLQINNERSESITLPFDHEKLEQKYEKMNQTYDDLDLLSDNEEIEEEIEEIIEEINDEVFDEKTEESTDSVLIINESKNEEIISNSTCPPPPNPTPIINNEVNELTVEVNNLNLDSSAPLPPNLSTTPMPEPSSFIEPVVVINYKKMKVIQLKKLCKTRGIKGYSKLKKKQLIELLSQ